MKTWMIKMFLAFLVLYTAEATFVDTSEWISIDCGTKNDFLDIKNMINWETDGLYIRSGENKNVSGNNSITLQMKTLRYFPFGNTNCYMFAVDGIGRYLIRARFYYGNYDGLSRPPTFDLYINDFKWTTVVSSLSDEPIVVEGIFSLGSTSMRVCLAQVREGDIPFISSLEITPIPFNTYDVIHLYSGFLLQDRATFGRNEDIVYNGNYTGDSFNRIWKARGYSSYPNISGSPKSPGQINYIATEPPDAVLLDAVESPRLSDPIAIPLNLSQANQSLCALLYFMELNDSRRPSDIRKLQIDLGSMKNVSTVDLQQGAVQLVKLCPEWVVGPLNITISPVQGSTLRPMLNAMEVYTIMDMWPLSPTSRAESLASPFFFLIIWMCVLGNMLA